jgi:putative peptide zinc metalloprotease protein
MSSRLLSNAWYRVAALKPRLRPHARLHRHRYRGEVWYLLQDRASGRVHRFTPAARAFIAEMDGSRSVAEIWAIANRRLGERAPTQDEVIQLLGQLHAADLLQSDVTPDVAELFSRGERELKLRRTRAWGNPMALRMPLWDPDAFLERARRWVDLMWSRWGAAAWLIVVLPALFLVPPHWPELTHNFSDHVLAVDNLLVLYLLFPVIKALHELGHASATKAGGGEVHDMGLILLVLMPVPYVEASAATAFRSKYRRAMVGAAGMAVELFLAALAFYAWLLVEPGIVKAVLFNVMLIAGVSTVVFNGNPLLRYDAYYILCDLIEMPNLSARALRYWGYLFERYALDARDAEAPDATRAEKAWFLFYGLAGTGYRMFVTIVIALFIASRFFLIGVLLALWALAAMALVPVVRLLRHVIAAPGLRTRRRRAFVVTFGSAAALALFLAAVPVPYHSDAEGVVWLSEQAMVRAGTGGFVERLLAQPGARVAAGDPLVLTREPALDAQLRLSEARLEELEASYASEFVADRAKAQMVREKLESVRAEVALAEERVGDAIVRARADGIFVAPQPADLPGRYFHKGELIGYVLGRDETPLVRVVVPQDSIDAVRATTDRVRVRLAGRPDAVADGRVVRQVPAGDAYLPSRALAVDGGGQIATDPRDAKGPKALERMFQFDVALPGQKQTGVFGERAYVRFEHRSEPLAARWYRDVRRLFLSHFGV